MVMTSRERVLTAIAHEEPDRVPLWFGASREMWEGMQKKLSLDDEGLKQMLEDDFRAVHASDIGPDLKDGVNRLGIKRAGVGCGQPLNHPLANATLKEVHAYAWPDPKWMDVSAIRSNALAWKGEYAILGGDWSPLWHDLIDLFGMERMYYLMYDAPELIDAVLERITAYYFEVSHRIFEAAKGAIDIFFIGNDLGSQTGPLLGEELFRRFILPHLKRLIELGHSYGLKVQMHCCGGFAPLIPALVESGLDALHALQTTCRGMNLTELKTTYGKKIVFNGGIDSHHVLINGTPDTIRSTTRDILSVMAPGGGYVAGASHDSILEETPVENVIAMCNAVKEFLPVTPQ